MEYTPVNGPHRPAEGTEFVQLLYRAAPRPRIVDVPPITFLSVDGAGDPNVATAYRDAISALYSLAYTLKFAVKQTLALNYHVFPLEGLWWTEDMADFSVARKSDWCWTMMIAQPEVIKPDLVDAAARQLRTRKSLPTAHHRAAGVHCQMNRGG